VKKVAGFLYKILTVEFRVSISVRTPDWSFPDCTFKFSNTISFKVAIGAKDLETPHKMRQKRVKANTNVNNKHE
jgi:hypothetical protein